MAAKLDSSSEFASLVNKLHQTPDDLALKQRILRRLPEMKAMAKVNPLALFQLAQVYPQNSAQYRSMMTQSAAAGCTNAMLSLCVLALKSPTLPELKKAARYMIQIGQSNDSYIQKQAKELIDSHPRLATVMKSQLKANKYKQTRCLFFNCMEDTMSRYSKTCYIPTHQSFHKIQ